MQTTTAAGPMQTISDLIEAFGSVTEFGKACGYGENPTARGSDIKRRNSIPVDRWPFLIAAAQARGIEGVSPDSLLAIHTLNSVTEGSPTPQGALP